RLKEVKTPEDAASLQDFIPQSNWKRYFGGLVDCDDSYLDSRWKKLYELRCKVAHNALMTGKDLEDAQKLIAEVKPKLLDAIAKLPRVTVPREGVELVGEPAAGGVNAVVGDFIPFGQLLVAVRETRAAAGGGPPRRGSTPTIDLLRTAGL